MHLIYVFSQSTSFPFTNHKANKRSVFIVFSLQGTIKVEILLTEIMYKINVFVVPFSM